MKKIYAVNGSPRNNFNTAKILQYALEGAAAAGAETELIQLGDLQYSPCRSCMACKRKGSAGVCAIKDELSEVLDKLRAADGIIMGSPVYFGNVSGFFRSFMERFYFSLLSYSDPPASRLGRSIPAAMIYTMNVPQSAMQDMGYYEELGRIDDFTAMILQCKKVETLYVCDTFQFSDYALYDAEWFDPQHKAAVRETVFPQDCAKAFDLGQRIARNA
jgi:multimeric flavodoxin WrbA